MVMPKLVRGVLSRAKMYTLGLSDGTQTSGTYYTRHTVAQTSFDLQVEFSNFYNSSGTETDGPNAITVKASIVDQSGNIHPLMFAGQLSITIQPGGTVRSDPLGRTFKRGELWFMRTYVSVASAGMKWPLGITTYGSNGSEGFSAGVDLTGGGAVTSVQAGAYQPTSFLGRPVGANADAVQWALVGDSIADGSGDSRSDAGMYEYALGPQSTDVPADYLLQRVCWPSDAPSFWTSGPRYSRSRRPFLDTATHVIDELGVNGLTNVSISQRVTMWQQWADRGLKVYATTLPPRTSSTDSWTTLGGQSTLTTEYIRVAYNEFVRSVPAPLSGYIEIADTCETARNSGKWLVNGVSQGPSSDGVHPSQWLHKAAAAPIRALFASVSGPCT